MRITALSNPGKFEFVLITKARRFKSLTRNFRRLNKPPFLSGLQPGNRHLHKILDTPGRLVLPRKSYAFPQKLRRSPESPMRFSRNYCVPPQVLCVSPEITAFPRKSYAFPQKLLRSPESPMRSPGKSSTLGSSRTAAGINTLFAAEAFPQTE